MMLMMFVGKVGPVSFVLSLTKQSGSAKNTVVPESRIIVG
jgi:Trk-type K+ transport system membrane component